jgi:hypothetical protein
VTRASFITPCPLSDRTLVANQLRATPANSKRLFISLKSEGQRKRAAEVRHVVIKHALS